MYFNSAGAGEALVKMLKVAGYIALAGAVTALIEYLASVQIDSANYTLVAQVGLANVILVGLSKWLSTRK